MFVSYLYNMNFLKYFIEACFLCIFIFPASGANLPPGFKEKVLAEGLDPTRIIAAPDGRIFIANKDGRIFIIEEDEFLPDPFIRLDADFTNERGLSGIALHPDFELNHWVYVYYTVAGENRNRISRITANGNAALAGSEEIIMDLDILPGNIHNGGAMIFTKDGKLVIAVGDGADAGTAQRMNTLHGKILRINDDGSIPTDNPFYHDLGGNLRAIYALGFRNPFTMAYHPEKDIIMINDVGASDYEEVNKLVKGGNFGWNLIEGYAMGQSLPDNYIDPLYAYDHNQGCAVIGSAFYNPEFKRFPEIYHDKYLFSDYCRGEIYFMDAESGEIEGIFATGVERPVDFLVTQDGAFYYIERRGLGGGSVVDNTSSTDGRIIKIEFTGSGEPFISSQPSDVTVSVGETARFEIGAGGDSPLLFSWFVNGEPFGTSQPILDIANASIEMDGSQIQVIVSNDAGQDTSQIAILNVTSNLRPNIEIFTSHDNILYRAGDTIFYMGIADDPEEGILPSTSLTWWIDFHHNTHTHPAQSPFSGSNEGFYVIPSIGEIDHNVWYRVYLRATDSEGLINIDYVDIYPEKIEMTVDSEPSGIEVRVNGKEVITPFTFTSVYGIVHSISAERIFIDENSLLLFEEWNNGSSSNEQIIPANNENKMITAIYSSGNVGSGSGLLGHYYNGTHDENVFNSPPEFRRLDPLINFDWVFGSPSPELLGNDDFLILWTGKIETINPGFYTFHTISDDGVRLWVDDKLVIDQWVFQAETEHTGSILLEGNRIYDIRIEYFESGGHAVMRLLWSNDLIPRSVVPTSQLYPDKDVPVSSNIVLSLPYPNPFTDYINISVHSLQNTNVILFLSDMSGRLIMTDHFAVRGYQTERQYELSNYPAGIYFLHVLSGDQHDFYKVIKIE